MAFCPPPRRASYSLCLTFKADLDPTVILLHHAQRDPSETTWYANPASAPCDTSSCSPTKLSSTMTDDSVTVVSLASDDHGTCTCHLVINFIFHTLHIVPLHSAYQHRSSQHGVNREIAHILEVSSFWPSTSPPTTPSSHRRSTSPPASIIPTSIRTVASVWTFCETSGAQPSPFQKVS